MFSTVAGLQASSMSFDSACDSGSVWYTKNVIYITQW